VWALIDAPIESKIVDIDLESFNFFVPLNIICSMKWDIPFKFFGSFIDPTLINIFIEVIWLTRGLDTNCRLFLKV
tara:strand:+ start:782 stop:1006 length:225 start_codon:yes stop_codon:yes gene_type:complete